MTFRRHEIDPLLMTVIRLRVRRGLTQQQIADRLNVSRRTVSYWECGHVMPPVRMLARYAQVVRAELVVRIPEGSDG